MKGLPNQGVVYFVSSGSFLSIFLLCSGYMWGFVSLFLLVSTSAINCLESLVSEMTCCVSSGMLNPTHSRHCIESFHAVSGLHEACEIYRCGSV